MRVYDLQVERDGYSFRLASGEEARALALLRQVVSPPDLRWLDGSARWWVAVGYEVTLSRLLDNFDQALLAALHAARAADPSSNPGAAPGSK